MADVRQLSLTSRDVMSNLSLRISVGRGFALRTRLAMALIRLAGWVLTVPVCIDFVERLDERDFDGAKALPPDQRRIEFANGKLLVSFWEKDGFRVWAQAVIRAPSDALGLLQTNVGGDTEFLRAEVERVRRDRELQSSLKLKQGNSG
ncbi:hypothetical protein [Salipiger bermudensis]|uniref:hypothetical protein n=1 Tax=Salipiger bermudensis TaxID=344736 RepID=UPI001CD3AF95|nr:hypothetical protein [Salipiger bermudensis]MCA0963234.1 hypothetical protein [Salipiger bermudensis]